MSIFKDVDYGRKISQKEHFDRMREARNSPDKLSDPRAEELRRDRIEFDLTIDKDLGVDFPLARRDEVWRVQKKIRSQHFLLLGAALVRRPWSPVFALFSIVVKRMSRVLTPDELAAMFDLDEEQMRAYLGRARYAAYLQK